MANRTVAVNLIARTAQFSAAMRNAGNDVATVQKKIRDGDAGLKRSQEQVSRGMLLVGGAAIAGAGMAVRAFAQFDKSMSNVRAVSGASADEMEQLRDAALEAGKATVFSASEAADATAELAKAGIGTADILGGALRGSLDLAAAGNLELADAATIAAQAMNIFKLEGDDVSHIADVLAAGANKSAADVKQLGDALRQGGLVAAQSGADLETTVAALSAFADNALIGSDAGTALKTMFQRLTPDTIKAQGAMEQIGLDAFDTQGKFIGLEAVAGQLQQGLGKLTEEERARTLEVIFGADAQRAANVLYEEGAAGIRDYTNAVNDNGAAQRMAADQLDNLTGDLEAFKGSVETALIQSGSGANGALRGMTQAATDAVNAFGNLPSAAQGAVTIVAGLGGAASVALGGLGYLVPKVREGRDSLRQLGGAGVAADRALGRLGKLSAYGAAAATAAVGFSILTEKIEELTGNGRADLSLLVNDLVHLTEDGTAAGEAARVLGRDFGELRSAVALLNGPMGEHITGFGLLPNRYDSARDKIGDVDAALASLVRSGNAEEARRQLELITTGMKPEHVRALRGRLDEYDGALADVDTNAALAADSQEEFAGAVEEVSPVVEEATDAVGDYKDALDALNGVNIDAARAQLQLAESTKDANKAVEKGSRVTNDETSALLDLAEQANDTASAIIDQTGSVDDASESMRKSRRAFIDVAQDMGYTEKQAKKLADQWLQIPTKRETKYSTSGVEGGITDLERLRQKILAIPTRRNVAVTVGTVNKLGAGGDGMADGGWVRGGRPGIDSVPKLLMPGEFVVKQEQAAKHGALLSAINSGSAMSGAFMGAGAHTAAPSGRGPFMRDLIVQAAPGERAEETVPRALDAQMFRLGG